jgi:hypothetical protein
MRVAKLTKDPRNFDLVDKHGHYAECLGLTETPTGFQMRLKFADDYRTTIETQRLRILQDSNIVRSPNA